MPASSHRWVRPCLLATLLVLGASFTWAVAQAQGPFGPPRIQPPGFRPPGIGPGPFVPPQPPVFNPNPGNPLAPKPGFGPNPGNPFGQNGPGFGPRPGIGPNIPNIQVPQLETVWKCNKCGQIVARGPGSHPPATCPFCGTRLINGFGPPANGPGVGGPANPGMPKMPPVAFNPPVHIPTPGSGSSTPGSDDDFSTGTLLLVGGITVGVLILLVVVIVVVVMLSGSNAKPRRGRKRRLARAGND